MQVDPLNELVMLTDIQTLLLNEKKKDVPVYT